MTVKTPRLLNPTAGPRDGAQDFAANFSFPPLVSPVWAPEEVANYEQEQVKVPSLDQAHGKL